MLKVWRDRLKVLNIGPIRPCWIGGDFNFKGFLWERIGLGGVVYQWMLGIVQTALTTTVWLIFTRTEPPPLVHQSKLSLAVQKTDVFLLSGNWLLSTQKLFMPLVKACFWSLPCSPSLQIWEMGPFSISFCYWCRLKRETSQILLNNNNSYWGSLKRETSQILFNNNNSISWFDNYLVLNF